MSTGVMEQVAVEAEAQPGPGAEQATDLLDQALHSSLLDPHGTAFLFLLAVGATVGVVVLAHALLTVLGL